MENHEVIKIMPKDKQLFIIDGYRIHAYTYDEAYAIYQKVLTF
jgi:hypothetical protein